MTISKESIKITKLDAAERQLLEAIRLFFEERDPVCVHTLAAAAVGVLDDLARSKGMSRPLRDSARIAPEHRNDWIAAINAAQNFFKHADRDPDASLEFRPGTTAFLMIGSGLALSQACRSLVA